MKTVLLLFATLSLSPQTKTPLEFEVASVKRMPDSVVSEVSRKKAPAAQGCHGSDSLTSRDRLSNASVPLGRCVFQFVDKKYPYAGF